MNFMRNPSFIREKVIGDSCGNRFYVRTSRILSKLDINSLNRLIQKCKKQNAPMNIQLEWQDVDTNKLQPETNFEILNINCLGSSVLGLYPCGTRLYFNLQKIS